MNHRLLRGIYDKQINEAVYHDLQLALPWLLSKPVEFPLRFPITAGTADKVIKLYADVRTGKLCESATHSIAEYLRLLVLLEQSRAAEKFQTSMTDVLQGRPPCESPEEVDLDSPVRCGSEPDKEPELLISDAEYARRVTDNWLASNSLAAPLP